VSLAGGRPQPVPGLGEQATHASVRGDRLVYTQMTVPDTDIWRVPGRRAASADRVPSRLISSSRGELPGAFSPDGRKIAFTSNRAGAWNIWISESDGSRPVQLTDLPGLTGSPEWSPDGRRIVFDSREGERGVNLFVVDVEGGVPRRLTQESSGNALASWSRDGRWIYFSSDRGGREQIWKIPAEGGDAAEVTRGGGYRPRESWDGRYLYYYKPGSNRSSSGVWRVPVEGGGETEVVRGFEGADWALSRSGLYFATRERIAGPGALEYRIRFLDFASGEVAEVFRREGPYYHDWLAVSPDDAWILYGATPPPQSELMLVENFH